MTDSLHTKIADELERGIDPNDIPAAEELMDKAAVHIRTLLDAWDRLEAALEHERARPSQITDADRMRWLRAERDAAVSITIERCAAEVEPFWPHAAQAIRALLEKPDA